VHDCHAWQNFWHNVCVLLVQRMTLRVLVLFACLGTCFYAPLPACTTEDGTGGDSGDSGCLEMNDASDPDAGGCVIGQGGLGQAGFGFGATGGLGASGGSAGFGS
jgi:hypothetical protein